MELNDRFYKSTEVSEILGVSLRTLYRYMDSGKIQSVQLPSGRHRFTKQQVESFLYSNGSGGLGQNVPIQSYQNNADRVYVDTGYSQNQNQNQYQNQNQNSGQGQNNASGMPNNQYNGQQTPFNESQGQQPVAQVNPYSAPVQNQNASPFASSPSVSPQMDNNVANTPAAPVEEEADDLDAELEELLASLESDSEDDTAVVENSSPNSAPQNNADTSSADQTKSYTGGLGGFADEEEVEEKITIPSVDENNVVYFYCPYNQLKAIARMVKTTSEDNGKNYAFTMNAGLSLYFPLDPFSVIHFYIEESDLDFWKDNLQLKESSKSDANIGLLLTKGGALNNTKEVSGLKVVSKEVMINNLKANGLENLISQVESKL